MITIQLVGLLIAITAIYLTYLHYKRASFSKKELLFWIIIWIAFIIVTLFPHSVRPIVGYLGLERPMDLIMIIAFIILFGLTFQNYITNRRQENRLEKLVRDSALRSIDTRDH